LNRIKQGSITKEEYKSPPPWPQYALFDYGKDYSLNKNAYNNLVQISDQMPVKYDSLFKDLSWLYININDRVNERELKLVDKYYTFKTHLTQNKDFFSDLYQQKALSDDAIDYFMNDPIYLNWVVEIDAYYRAHRRSLINFVEYATMVLNEIDELELRVD
jgi:hypothetical protein